MLAIGFFDGYHNKSFAQCVPVATANGYEICEPTEIELEECEVECGCADCSTVLGETHTAIAEMLSEAFIEHRIWMIDVFFTGHIRYAMSLMTHQMTAVAMEQVKIIGGFFDAKHQLETQRLFQKLMAEAHSDYQTSEGMCDIGTTARGLYSSDRKVDLTKQVLSKRVMARQLRSGRGISRLDNSDILSRIGIFRDRFCNKQDNAANLDFLCDGVEAPRATKNKDVDYTRTIDSELTIDIDFSKDDGAAPSLDEEAVYALMANLFGHTVFPNISDNTFADGTGAPKQTAHRYMNLRSIAAKRSVAQNSISSIIAERAEGDKITEHAPFVKSALVELGVPPEEVNLVTGNHPSYFAQMEVLTKKLYQNPVFYTELYDNPTNVMRKGTSIRAISLMQDRDFFKSLLRTEAVLAVALESMLYEEHDRVYRNLNKLDPDGDPIR